jgi:hypothetical protein
MDTSDASSAEDRGSAAKLVCKVLEELSSLLSSAPRGELLGEHVIRCAEVLTRALEDLRNYEAKKAKYSSWLISQALSSLSKRIQEPENI